MAGERDKVSSNLRWLGLYCYSGFRDCLKFHRPEHLKLKPIDYLGFVQVFIAKFVLEVCGAAGAIWGSSEILTIRNGNNNDIWRILSLVVFGMFAIRFWWHSKHYLEHDREFPPIKLKHRRLHKVSFSQIFLAKLVLEVLGAAGAIWGPADALTLRTADNIEQWRIASILVLCLFSIRWVLQVMTYCLVFKKYMDQRPQLNKILAWCEVLLVRFVLVVLGAIGAVWGFSEIVTLRTPETNHFWRPFSWSVGLVFFARWLLQAAEYALGLWEEDLPPPDHSSRSLEPGSDKDLDDLELTETPVPTSPLQD